MYFAWALFNVPLMEWFWLIELLSVLRSGLIGVSIGFGGPAGSIPQSGVHHVSRAIILQGLSRAVQIGFILYVLVELDSAIVREFALGVAVSEDRAWVPFGVDVAGAECRLGGCILGVVVWMRLWLRLRAVSPRRRVEGVIGLGDVVLVESTK